MCEIYSSTPPDQYKAVTRSVRLNGAVTSVRLEQSFWDILEEVAEAEGLTLSRFLANLHDEALARHGEIGNFASLLRVACSTYLKSVKPGLDVAI